MGAGEAGPWTSGRRLAGPVRPIFLHIMWTTACVCVQRLPGDAMPPGGSETLGPGVHVDATLIGATHGNAVADQVNPDSLMALPSFSRIMLPARERSEEHDKEPKVLTRPPKSPDLSSASVGCDRRTCPIGSCSTF